MPVKIHGKDYTTCAERLATFHKRFKDNKKSIISEIIQFKDGIVVIKTVVKVDEEVYVGHAYEEIGSTQINTTSALENCETSSLARSLKFCLGDVDLSNEIASAEEVATAINKQEGGYKMKSPQNKPAVKTDFSNDKWRDNPIGFKSGKNEGKSYRQVDDDTLIWIINQCKVESWKEKAIKEMQLRQDGQKTSVSKKEVDDLFNTNEGDKDAK